VWDGWICSVTLLIVGGLHLRCVLYCYKLLRGLCSSSVCTLPSYIDHFPIIKTVD
jgi:hypothetical protein